MRFLILLLLLAPTASANDILVLAPKSFHGALDAWLVHRTKQGHKIAIMEPGKDPRETVKLVHKEGGGKLRFVLLVGDVKQVPYYSYPATIIKKWERDPMIASDNRTADLDGDHLPDLAIGRIPADTPEEAKLMLGKVIDYENSRDMGKWRRRVNVIASVGGFGAFQDSLIEKAATMFLTKNVPASYDMHVTYAKPTSPFCPPPSKVMETTIERFNEGALFVAYIGHGHKLGFDRCRFQGNSWKIFDEDAAFEVKSRHGLPIAFLLCCTTGHFDGAPDCIGELLIKRPKGPVAVIAASRVSMPYGNAPFAKELLQAIFKERAPTLGHAFTRAKRRTMMDPKKYDEQRNLIEGMAKIGYETDDAKRKAERIEHLYLYNLLGDPCMRLPHPAQAKLTAPASANAGETITVTIESPVSGSMTLELMAERTPSVSPRQGDSDADFKKTYERSNNWVRAAGSFHTQLKNVPFRQSFKIPRKLKPGRYDLRLWVDCGSGPALGTTAINIQRGEQPGARK